MPNIKHHLIEWILIFLGFSIFRVWVRSQVTSIKILGFLTLNSFTIILVSNKYFSIEPSTPFHKCSTSVGGGGGGFFFLFLNFLYLLLILTVCEWSLQVRAFFEGRRPDLFDVISGWPPELIYNLQNILGYKKEIYVIFLIDILFKFLWITFSCWLLNTFNLFAL